MERNTAGTRGLCWMWPALCLAILPAAGCTAALSTAMYIIRGHTIPAEFEGLRDRRVAVVCRPPATDQFRNAQAGELLARELGRLLNERVSKIEVVDYRDVANWQDEHTWRDPTELARGVEADMLVFVDLNAFDIYQGQTLYQGRARVSLAVYDMEQDGAVVFEKELPPSTYPPNVGVPTSERPDDSVFRNEYVRVLADEIGRHFYAHDALADVARDSDAL